MEKICCQKMVNIFSYVMEKIRCHDMAKVCCHEVEIMLWIDVKLSLPQDDIIRYHKRFIILLPGGSKCFLRENIKYTLPRVEGIAWHEIFLTRKWKQCCPKMALLCYNEIKYFFPLGDSTYLMKYITRMDTYNYPFIMFKTSCTLYFLFFI